MLNTFLHSVADNDTTVTQNTISVQSHLPNVTNSTSFQHGCNEIRFSEMEFIPWNNSDNIVGAEVEDIAIRFKNNMLGFLFLIGGPGNVINIVVFYKQGLKDRVNLCLFALSLADGLYLTVGMLLYGEQLHLQFITKDKYGPVMTFMENNHVTTFVGLYTVSPILSAIIAVERCYCVCRPLKYQTLMRTRTMAAIIIVVFVVVISLFYIVTFRYHVGCLYDPETGEVFKAFVVSDLYNDYKDLVDFLDGYVFALGLPGLVMMAVVISTIITIVKLRQIMTWRAGTTSSLSPQEVALTKMLVGSSILFISCVGPAAMIRVIWLIFPEVNAGHRNHNLYLSLLWIGETFTFLNATFNIFVYYAMGSRYRETFWMLCKRKRVKVDKA